jgi:hypothetical protein
MALAQGKSDEKQNGTGGGICMCGSDQMLFSIAPWGITSMELMENNSYCDSKRPRGEVRVMYVAYVVGRSFSSE